MSNDVLDLLTEDHREVMELVDQVLASADASERRELTDRIIGQLVRHSVAEETVVYPVMRRRLPEGEQAVQHDTDEHKQLEVVMKQLEGEDAAQPAFLQAVQQLKAVLTDHISDEEDEQFPKLRAELSEDERAVLAVEVEALKKVAPTRPHPNAPNTMLFHLMVGPGVGLVDRLRDTISGRVSK